jgi:hypothetical protein
VPDMSEQEQYQAVHEAIQAVASRCDGAVTRDMQGFDGQDTKYGRRMAAVSFSTLTADDRAEEARIILKYRQQVLRWLGTDVATLPVVLEAQGFGTNYASRDNARSYERRERNAGLRDERKATAVNGKIALMWAKKDPDFAELLAAVKALPGRSFDWDRKANMVPAGPDVLAFLDRWDIAATDEVRALCDVQAKPARFADAVSGKIAISFPKEDSDFRDILAEVQQLPGRRFNWDAKTNDVAPTGEAEAVLIKWEFEVSPAAAQLLEGARAIAPKKDEATEVLKVLLSKVSRATKADEIPAEFAVLVRQAMVGA